jgi:hypothetical protein
MTTVNDGVPATAGDEPAVHRPRDRSGDHEAESQAPPDRPSRSPAAIAPGIATTIALSTISMTVIEAVSAAKAIGIASRNGIPGTDQRPERQAVAEDECQDDRKHDRGQVVPAKGRGDHEAKDLADRAAGQAVDGR